LLFIGRFVFHLDLDGFAPMFERTVHQSTSEVSKMTVGVVLKVQGLTLVVHGGNKVGQSSLGVELQHLDVNHVVDGGQERKRGFVSVEEN